MDAILEMLVSNKLPNVTLSMDQVCVYHSKFEKLKGENHRLTLENERLIGIIAVIKKDVDEKYRAMKEEKWE